MNTRTVTMPDGTVYTILESVSTVAAIEWMKRYLGHQDVGDPGDGPKHVSAILCRIACNLDDFEFLARAVLVGPDGRGLDPTKIPLRHVPALVRAMRPSLHIEEFMDAILSDDGSEAAEPGDPEKN